MKICYASMPFGVKHDAASGRTVDHDQIYRQLIAPAAHKAGLVCQRADDFVGSLIHKDIAKAIITADVMLADVSSGNANVMYELGIRHALRRGATVLLSSTRVPFNIAQIYAVYYDVAPDGGPDSGRLEETLATLADVLRERAERSVSDSPLYEYFPGLRIELPPDLESPELRRRTYPVEVQVGAARGPDRKSAVAHAEQVTRGTKDVDPQAYLDLLRRYGDLAAWDEVVRLAGELPPEVASLPQVAHSIALAQRRLGNIDAAINVLKHHVSLTGGDSETHGLLGSFYKRRHFMNDSVEDLDAAIDQYRRALERNSRDLYLGHNLVQLLHRKGSDAARDELADLLPELCQQAELQMGDSVPDYWLLESALILNVIASEWPAAEALVYRMIELQPEAWMLDSTRTELRGVLERMIDTYEGERLRALIERLQHPPAADEAEEEADGAQL